ncbi:MAG: helix-turn-helix domain-containing protein [Chloroflexota bacterium]|nr:MAG: CdaR family transcriptional regulator [Chloroflexota bacterium]
MPPITVRDVMRLALPSGTSVAAGAAGLSHQVTWVVTPRATPPVFSNLRGGELALVPMAAVQQLDERMTLADLVERLAPVPIAGVVVVGEIGEPDRAAAERARTPLLQLPSTADVREVEREVQRLIGDYEAQLERRAAQLGALLTQRSLSGAGLSGLLETLAERTGRGLAVYSAAGELRSLKARGPARVALQTLQPSATGLINHLGQQIWVQQLGAGGGDALGRGYGYLALSGDALDDWDRMAAQQGSGVIALELAKEHAVLAAEERLRGDFVQTVLAGPPADSEALLQRGRELGYDLRQPHVALLASVNDQEETSRVAAVVNAALSSMGVGAPTMRRADGVLCFLPLAERGRRAHEVAEQLRARLAADIPGIVLAIGREAPTVSAWPRSLREAEQALRIGRQLFDNRRVLSFSDLGVYRLLILLRESPELWEFYRATLAALADYDRDQKAELIKTLEAFFDNLGNLAQTAVALHVHRNTLLYRLERVKQISGLDLEDPEDRLALWLALKAHRVLRTLDSPNGNE